MRNATPTKTRKPVMKPANDLAAALSERIVGQESSIKAIVPYIQMYHAGLSPEGRPVGVFLLLGPTGTGKTRTVEALAEAIHGSERNVLRIDCGEFQMEHEVAKLIGAPPGYLGHRETQPMLTQQKLNAVASERANLSIILFDEIEKAAASLQRLLLGILDKATLRLGDNTAVNFERSIIFLTSNLGARSMTRELRPDFGFEQLVSEKRGNAERKLETIGLAAVRKKFSPEFVNRIDVVSTYQPLGPDALSRILDQQLADLQRHVNNRLGPAAFHIEVKPASRHFLLAKGTSLEYGARELKRTIHRHVIQPIAALASSGAVEPGGCIHVDVDETREKLSLRPRPRDLNAFVTAA